MSINNNTPVKTHLFNNVSRGNFLLKIDILTSAENFCEWEIIVKWVLRVKRVLNWVKIKSLIMKSFRWPYYEKIDSIIQVWFLLNVVKNICQYVYHKQISYNILINIKTVFDACDQMQLTLLLQEFIMYKAQSGQFIDKIFIKLNLMHTQIEEIDLIFTLNKRLQDIILQMTVNQKLYALSITLLESKQELSLQETIHVLKKAESKIRLTNESAIESVNYIMKIKCDNN